MGKGLVDVGVLRKGYTTGTCAAAASKAAATAFLSGKRIKEVEVTLPIGNTVTLPVFRCEIYKDKTIASVIKDAGDDPDITNGAEIEAVASGKWQVASGVKAFRFSIFNFQFSIYGGQGIGIVTKPGLAVPVGEPAINPVPRRMIEDSIKGISDLKSSIVNPELASGQSPIVITLSIPNGEGLAKKTMNRRLGIIGGLSILGTTGVVEPLSLSAYRESIICALDVALASGCKEIVLSTGRSSERVAQRSLNLPEESFILVGDHMGFALKEAGFKGSRVQGFRKITIVGQFGKLSKLAAGHFKTHCRDSSIELDFIAGIVKETGVKERVVDKIRGANTARQAFYILKEKGLSRVFKVICKRIKRNAEMLTGGEVNIGCLLVGYDDEIVEYVNVTFKMQS